MCRRWSCNDICLLLIEDSKHQRLPQAHLMLCSQICNICVHHFRVAPRPLSLLPRRISLRMDQQGRGEGVTPEQKHYQELMETICQHNIVMHNSDSQVPHRTRGVSCRTEDRLNKENRRTANEIPKRAKREERDAVRREKL